MRVERWQPLSRSSSVTVLFRGLNKGIRRWNEGMRGLSDSLESRHVEIRTNFTDRKLVL